MYIKIALPTRNKENKKTSSLNQNTDKNSNFKKKPGKGGTPLIANITETQTVTEVVVILEALEITASFSAPDKRPTEKNTRKYNKSNFFHSPPANIGISVKAPKKKIEENKISFFVLLTKSTQNLTNSQAKILIKTR